MFLSYLKIGLRVLRERLGYTFINVFSLAVGLACCILIGLYIQDELSYDDFHAKSDRIYRLGVDATISGNELEAPVAAAPASAALQREFPEVEQGTRLFALGGDVLVENQNQAYIENRFYYADSTFFKVFSFPVVKGDPVSLLEEPNTVVLTESTAEKFFSSQNVVGKTLRANGTEYRVTGVIEDLPHNSHMHFDFLASMGSLPQSRSGRWTSSIFHTYLVLEEGASGTTLEPKLQNVVKKYVGPQLEQALGMSFDRWKKSGGEYSMFLQPLTDIHLYSHMQYELEPNGSIAYLYAFGAVAIFILLIACANFVNLATARSTERAQEVGVRKTVGAFRLQLAGQFLGEALLMSAAALVLSLLLVWATLPLFNALAGKPLTIASLFSTQNLGIILGLTALMGLIAGGYPSFVLSRYNPAEVLQSESTPRTVGGSSSLLRRGLVVFQFAIAVALIASTVVVYNQLDYIRSKDLGFDEDRVVVLKQAEALGQSQQTFVKQIERHPNVQKAAITTSVPGRQFGQTAFQPEQTNQTHSIHQLGGGYDVVGTLGLNLIEGRDFSRDRATDSTAVILNEAAVKELGWSDPIGRRLKRPGPRGRSGTTFTTIGVVEDFHFQSLHREIRPLAILPEQSGEYVSVRVRSGNASQALASLKSSWGEFRSDLPLSYFFLDNEFEDLHRTSQRTGRLVGVFSIVAIVIACLGLFGLSTFLAKQRTGEIGIRKALGASTLSIVRLLTRRFLALVVVALLIGGGLAWMAMQRWLSNFAYRIELGIGVFLLAGIVALVIAVATIGYKSLQTAQIDPATAIRD